MPIGSVFIQRASPCREVTRALSPHFLALHSRLTLILTSYIVSEPSLLMAFRLVCASARALAEPAWWQGSVGELSQLNIRRNV